MSVSLLRQQLSRTLRSWRFPAIAGIGIVLNVRMDTDLGKSGGYTWQTLWTLWDARYGELVFLVYSEFTAATTSRVAPEKEWAEPFASRLWKMLSTDLSKLENH